MEWKLQTPDPAKARDYFEKKMSFTLGPMEVKYYREQKEPFNIIDVRAEEDYAVGHVPGAINLPQEQWQSFKGLSKDKVNIIYCYTVVCHLAAKAAFYFSSNGYPVMELEGGFEAWKDYEMPIERSEMRKTA